MFPSPDAVPSLAEYARTMYADALSYRDQGKDMASLVADKLGDLATVVLVELERRTPPE